MKITAKIIFFTFVGVSDGIEIFHLSKLGLQMENSMKPPVDA